MKKMEVLTNDIILKAAAGNGDALEKVLARYDAYINAVATERIVTPNGRVRYMVNEECKSYIQMRLIEAILKWRVISNDPS